MDKKDNDKGISGGFRNILIFLSFFLVMILLSNSDSLGFFIFLVISVFAYLTPSIIAGKRKHNSSMAIVALNIILGWTLLGWVGALIWSLTGNVKKESLENR